MAQEKQNSTKKSGLEEMYEKRSEWLSTRPFDPNGLEEGYRCPKCHTNRIEERAIDSGSGLVYVLCSECGYDAWVKP